MKVISSFSSSYVGAWFCLKRSVPVVRMAAVVFANVSLLPHGWSCNFAPWGQCCLLVSLQRGQTCRTWNCGAIWFLRRGARIVERGTVVLGFSAEGPELLNVGLWSLVSPQRGQNC